MKISRQFLAAILVIAGLAVAGGEVRALTLADTNLVDLLRNATSILKGTVTAVTDGVDATGLRYTEITVEIAQNLRGSESGTYTFRQFGLMEPRLSDDGTKLQLPLDGLPRYSAGEEVLLFLSKPAAVTGLRSTYGLGNGKFSFGAARVENDMANQGLFQNVSIDPSLVTDSDTRMLETSVGSVNQDDFMSLVDRAVAGSWVQRGLMWKTDEERPQTSGGRRKNRVVTRVQQ